MHNLSFTESLFPTIIEQLPGFISLRDCNSRFMFTNEYTARMLGYSGAEAMVGSNPRDYLCPVAGCADEFMRQDRYVTENKKELNVLAIMTLADSKQHICFGQKKPFILKGEVVGNISHYKEVKLTNLQQIIYLLMQSDGHYDGNTQDRTYAICHDGQAEGLSEREFECLFYLLRGRTFKEIADTLSLSSRTVESYINSIKMKWQCDSKGQVIDYAINHGLLSCLPRSLTVEDNTHVLGIDS